MNGMAHACNRCYQLERKNFSMKCKDVNPEEIEQIKKRETAEVSQAQPLSALLRDSLPKT